MEKLLSILAIAKSQGVPPSREKLHPFLYPLQSQEHGKGTNGRAETGAGFATLRSLENTYLEGSNQVPQEYHYEKPLQRCQDTGFAGHAGLGSKRKTFLSLFPVCRTPKVFLSPLRVHDHKYFSLVWLSWNYSGTVLLWDLLQNLQWSCQECQWMKPSWEIMASPGRTRVILLIFHFMISCIMQNTKISSLCFGVFFLGCS